MLWVHKRTLYPIDRAKLYGPVLHPYYEHVFALYHCIRLAVTYKDLRSVPDFTDKTILAVKAPPDTILNCDVQEVS